MTKTFSTVTSAATAAYGVFALVKPAHLPDGLEVRGPSRSGYLTLARVYGVRDLAISAAGVAGNERVTTVAMGLRIASDLTDFAVLMTRPLSTGVKVKVAAVTLGWAAVNTAALVADRRRTAQTALTLG